MSTNLVFISMAAMTLLHSNDVKLKDVDMLRHMADILVIHSEVHDCDNRKRENLVEKHYDLVTASLNPLGNNFHVRNMAIDDVNYGLQQAWKNYTKDIAVNPDSNICDSDKTGAGLDETIALLAKKLEFIQNTYFSASVAIQK